MSYKNGTVSGFQGIAGGQLPNEDASSLQGAATGVTVVTSQPTAREYFAVNGDSAGVTLTSAGNNIAASQVLAGIVVYDRVDLGSLYQLVTAEVFFRFEAASAAAITTCFLDVPYTAFASGANIPRPVHGSLAAQLPYLDFGGHGGVQCRAVGVSSGGSHHVEMTFQITEDRIVYGAQYVPQMAGGETTDCCCRVTYVALK